MSLLKDTEIDSMGMLGEFTLRLDILDAMIWAVDTQVLHYSLLENKLNAYIRFIQSGQGVEEYPEETIKGYSILILFKTPPPPSIDDFVAASNQIVSPLKTVISWGLEADDIKGS